MKRLERKLDFEKPLMDKGVQLGSQKSLFPSRRTEQEFMIFKEIFIEPKEKELEKLNERAKIEREQYEKKVLLMKPKKRTLRPLTAQRRFDLDLNSLNTDTQSKKKFEELISQFKNLFKGQK